MKQPIVSLLIISILLGIIFDVLFYGKLPGLSVLVFVLLSLLAVAYLAKRYKRPLSASAYILMAPAVFFAGMVGVRANGLLTFFNIVLVIYLLLLIVQSANRPALSVSKYSFGQYFVRPAWLPLRFVREAFKTVRGFVGGYASLAGRADRRAYVPYIRGIALSLPFLVIFFLLLSSADLVFQKYLGSLFDFDFNLDGEVLFRIATVAFVTSLFIGAYALMFTRPPVQDKAAGNTLLEHRLSTTEANIMLGSVGLLFLVFVLIQIASFFGGTAYVTSAGVTYAEYARKGFFELIAVAVLSMALIWVVKTSLQHTALTATLEIEQAPLATVQPSRQTDTFKWLSGLLVVEVMIIIASAHTRLSAYEEAYGFTMLRLLSHMFIFFLALTFISLLVHIIRTESDSKFALRTFLSVVAFFAILNIMNPDAIIAHQNINRFEETGKIDIIYLKNLSEDAMPVTAKLLDHPDNELQNSVAKSLYPYLFRADNKKQPWQSANSARQQAHSILMNNREILETNKQYQIPDRFDTY